MFQIKNLTVSVSAKAVVQDFSLTINSGEIHALMGPNGSGKSSLAYAIAGHSEYQITNGGVTLDGMDITKLSPEKRAEAGIFLSFQEPPEVGGVSMHTFLQMIAPKGIRKPIDPKSTLEELGLQDNFLQRFLNEGFSGGEKKKSELLQLIARKPKIAICDEIDSGLDLDALKAVARVLKQQARQGAGLLLISHSPRLFELIEPNFAHILSQRQLVASGGCEILEILAKKGYCAFNRPYFSK